jgi:hypothetical protein
MIPIRLRLAGADLPVMLATSGRLDVEKQVLATAVATIGLAVTPRGAEALGVKRKR